MTTYSLRKGSAEKIKSDVVVVGVVQTEDGLQAAPGAEGVASAYGRRFAPLLSTMGFTGKAGETTTVPTGGVIKSPLLILVGLGERDRLTTERVRRAAGVAARSVSNASTVALALPALDADHVRAIADGYLLGSYAFTAFKSADAPGTPNEVVILSDVARSKDAGRALETAQVVARATCLARDWVNTPAGNLTPPLFADAVTTASKDNKDAKVTVKVTDEARLEADGYGGIIGVGRASANPPRLVELSYKPRGAKAHLALVGKGITFDSGGLSLKPGAAMTTMKIDMSGAAAVIAATFAIAELGLPVRVSTFAPMAENMVSGNATRPGDVLTMYGGKTVEVLNTDAEGRLILADALVKATEQSPDLIVDVATLTGACVIALGDRVAGILGNDEETVKSIKDAGERAGEAFWPLPITSEMTEKVRTNSKVADLAQHNSERWGGTLYAAAFLQEFVGDTTWAHLDIAGPAFNEKGPHGYTPSGGTGIGVSTLVQVAQSLSDGHRG
ncbi:MAG: Cytosol aminopeptidase PepA [uncultured Nocardioidaceae bacterium]|uniref:Probable cytosol aminopeptidase n=1 Tax=uncultured Nocardioidaceae bacterium TaxID=253824 RepID=A0A6J4MLH8_9ACTN|nr:MAG: Cytosol aminopeptidase PepA [uncultured Nocardioidaceae bacterium]